MKHLKNRIAWAGALALALGATSQVTALGQTNGVIMIVTRYEQDLSWFNEDGDANDGMVPTGGGMASQGDVAMAELLSDYGYPTRIIIDMELQSPGDTYAFENPYLTSFFGVPFLPDPTNYLAGGSSYNGIIGFDNPKYWNTNYRTCLIIQSGSANSSHAPQLAKFGIPYMCGEHTLLGQRANKPGSFGMYYGTSSDDPSGDTLSDNQYMIVTAAGKAHPIMQGIPLDAQDRVKIYRDPYPEEVIGHRPAGCNPLWQWDIPYDFATNAAPGTSVLGLMGTDPNKSIFAVVDVGGQLADGSSAKGRLVHFFVCEGGQDSYRRVFNSLSDMGRLIFVRAAKWAMGETLTPYQPLGVIQTSMVSPNKLQLQWSGSSTKNYKVLGTTDLQGPSNFSNWQTLVEDIHGIDPGVGPTSVKLDISNGPQYAFLRVVPVP
jgi:hypothetical protein